MTENCNDRFLFDIAFEQSLMHAAMNIALAESDQALQVDVVPAVDVAVKSIIGLDFESVVDTRSTGAEISNEKYYILTTQYCKLLLLFFVQYANFCFYICCTN